VQSLLTICRRRPRTVHAPHAERIAESLGCWACDTVDRQVTTHRKYPSHWTNGRRTVVVTAQHLVQEVDVPRRQAQCLDLAQLVGRQSWDDLAKLAEGVVERLRTLALADVGKDALVTRVVER